MIEGSIRYPNFKKRKERDKKDGQNHWQGRHEKRRQFVILLINDRFDIGDFHPRRLAHLHGHFRIHDLAEVESGKRGDQAHRYAGYNRKSKI